MSQSLRSLVPSVPTPSWSRRLVLVVVTIVGAGLLSLTACQVAPTPASLDAKVYGTSMPVFLRWWQGEHARSQGVSVATVQRWWREQPARLDSPAARRGPWDLSTDLCSSSPDRGPTFDFRGPCVRHDFAWRNLRRLAQRGHRNQGTPAQRRRASDQFGRDLRWSCTLQPSWAQPSCRALATVYHRAVLAVS